MEYLAFDFGAGTTTAAHYGSLLKGEPEVLNICKGMREIWSCIGFDEKGENPLIGEVARNTPNYVLKSNWKSYPSRYKRTKEGREKRQISVEFMRRVFLSFLSQNRNYSMDGTYCGHPYKVILGAPCDWNMRDIAEYKCMALEAGLPNVEVIKESQAAMFYARRWMCGGISDEEIKKGVLIIDVGSSTTDFTFIKGADVVLHKGLPLGASFVERAFLNEGLFRENVRYWASKKGDASKWRIVSPNKVAGLAAYEADLMDVRQYKEAYFSSNAVYWVRQRLNASGIFLGENKCITQSFVDYCLDVVPSPGIFSLQDLSKQWNESEHTLFQIPNSWRGHFRTALEHIKCEWGLSDEVKIVLTGGASRMSFIDSDVCEVFHKDRETFFGNDDNRSFSVVKGLAWAGYARDSIRTVKEAFKAKDLGADEAVMDVVQKFAERLLKPHVRKITKKVEEDVTKALASHNPMVGSMRKLMAYYSEVMCKEINVLIKKMSSGFEVNLEQLLKIPTITAMGESLNELFSRPNVKLESTLCVNLPWAYKTCQFGFNIFEGCLWCYPMSEDESFEGCLGWGRMYDNALAGFVRNFSEKTVLGILQDSTMATTEAGEIVTTPSEFEVLCDLLLQKIKEFKMREFEALLGSFE